MVVPFPTALSDLETSVDSLGTFTHSQKAKVPCAQGHGLLNVEARTVVLDAQFHALLGEREPELHPARLAVLSAHC